MITNRTVKSSPVIAGVAAAALALVGCSSGSKTASGGATSAPASSGNSSSAAGGAGSTSASSTSASGSSTVAGKTIAFVPGVVGNAFYISMECGIRAEAAKYGLKVKLQGPQAFDPSLQTPIVNGVIAQKPLGMIIAPDDSTAMYVPISNAAKAGIKVALVDTTLKNLSPVITSIATDNVAGGAAAAQDLAKLVGNKGKVLVLPFKAGAATSDDRQHGFEAEIKKFPNIKSVTPQYTNNDPARAASEVASTLAANPDLAGIYATNDRSVEGTATALRNAGKIGKVKVVAFDTGEQQVQELQQGIVQALIGQVPLEIGANAVSAVVASATGKPVKKTVVTTTVTVTKANLNTPEGQRGVYKTKC